MDNIYSAKKADIQDPRAKSVVHMFSVVFPAMKNPPKYILIENVKGFEVIFVIFS